MVGYDGKDLQKRKVLSQGWKSEGVMDDESGESMESMEEVPLIQLGEAELERLVRGWRRGARSWFQRRGENSWSPRWLLHRINLSLPSCTLTAFSPDSVRNTFWQTTHTSSPNLSAIANCCSNVICSTCYSICMAPKAPTRQYKPHATKRRLTKLNG